MKKFDEFISKNIDNVMEVSKVKALAGKEMRSGIGTGRVFRGQATLHRGDVGCILVLDGGYTMNTSLIKGVVQKGPKKWLVKTLNSVYKVEVVK